MKIFSAFILMVLSTQFAAAQSPKQLLTDNPLRDHLDSAVQKQAAAYMQNAGAVGLSIGVYKNGRSHIYNYGESVKGSGILPKSDQLFNLGSVAKTFVGTMLAEAVIEKKAKLTDDIRLYLPGKYPNLQYKGHPVTLVDIANHTSGLPGSSRDFPAAVMDSLKKLGFPGQLQFYLRYNQDSLVKDLHHLKIDTIPGTKYHYNGNAMMILIFLLERIYHQPYETLVTHYLKTNLNMYDTRTRIPVKQFGRFMQGYDDKGVAIQWLDRKNIHGSDVNTTLFYAGGPSMNSTMNDMMKYLKAQIADTDPAIRLTHKLTWGPNPKEFAIGLNWQYDLEDGVKDYYHSGHTGIGFNTLCEFYPTEKLGFMIVVNDTMSQDKVSQLENDLHKAVK
jgi:CubicO group peptidase (beta-lactamase class C family)